MARNSEIDWARKKRGVEIASGATPQSGAASDWVQVSMVDLSPAFAAYFIVNGPGGTSNTAATRDGFPVPGVEGVARGTSFTDGAVVTVTSSPAARPDVPDSTGSHATTTFVRPSAPFDIPTHTSTGRFPGCRCASVSSAPATRGSSVFAEASAAAASSFELGAK